MTVLVGWLVKWGIRPNSISLASLGFSTLAAITIWYASREQGMYAALLWHVAALAILLRLLANMLDGMVAVATGTQSRLGDLFNELPDRISDGLILTAMGCAIDVGNTLGLLASLAAFLAAYVRLLGNQIGVQNLFCGPLAKQQRMTIAIALCLSRSLLPVVLAERLWLAGLWCLIAGTTLTVVRRLYRIKCEVAR